MPTEQGHPALDSHGAVLAHSSSAAPGWVDPNADHCAPTAHCPPFSCLTSDISRPLTILHAVAPTINRDHLGMMKQPVEERRGKHLVSEQLSPGGKAGVGGE